MSYKFLTKSEILQYITEGKLVIEPLLSEDQITSVGIDLRLDTVFREYSSSPGIIDVSEERSELELYQLHRKKVIRRDDSSLEIEPIMIHRNEFIIAQTLEYICLPNSLTGFLDGRSSLARRGIIVHATAGSIEPGFRGHITLELGNISKIPVKIYPLMRVANLHLAYVGETEEYSGQFWGQVKVKPAKPDKDLLKLLGIERGRK